MRDKRFTDFKEPDSGDDEAIDKKAGTAWTSIVNKYDELIGNKFLDEEGTVHTFIGLLHGQDDYYFVMFRDGKVKLLTCVGIIEDMGFYPVP